MESSVRHLIPHLRIVSAFIIREMATRYGRSPGGYVWAFLEPVAYVVILSTVFEAFARVPALGESFPLFFATGYIPFSMYNGMAAYLSSTITANKNLLQYPNVAQIDPVVARVVLQAFTSIIVAVVILFITENIETHPHKIFWYALFESVICAWMLAIGISLTNIVLFERIPIYEKIFGIIMRPLFMLSGVFYVPSDMPHPFKEVLLANPVTQIIIRFREGFYGAGIWDGLDLGYMFEFASVLLFTGLLIFTLWPVGRRQ